MKKSMDFGPREPELTSWNSQLLTAHSYYLYVKLLVTQLCPTLCDPMDCSPPDSSAHGILQAKREWLTTQGILDWRIPRTKEPSRLHTVHGVAKIGI